MPHESVFTAAAWLEIVMGAIFVTAPDVLCLLLFADKPQGIGMPLARFVGVILVVQGISCLPSTTAGPRRSAVLGLLAFNVGMAILFTWVGVATTLRGFLLWPAAILHAVIAAALLQQLLTRGSFASSA